MYDIKTIRENPDLVKNDLNKRGDLDKITWVDDVLKYDKEWRTLITEANRLREQRNKVTAEIAELMKRGKDVEKKIEEAKKIPEEINRLENSAREYRDKMDNILLRLPNLMHESVVIGKDENDNVEIRRWGDPRQFDFEPKDHIDISLALDLVDLKKAAKVAGARFYYLKNELVQLNYALINYALDFLREKDFTLYQPPYMLKKEAIAGAVDLSDFEDVIYKVENEDLHLIATSEHPLLALHMGEILSGKELPIRYCGVSPCFRKEAGAHGRDTKGIFRVHQFEKVEQFIFCKPEDSWDEHEYLISNAEEFFQKLELPYRIVNVCSGDLGTVAAKKYDLEVWLPGQNKFREAVSCSNCTTYQAIRSKIRFRDKPNEPTNPVHTLNSTLVATERALIAIIENYQQKDGSIDIPETLIPYMNNLDKILKKS